MGVLLLWLGVWLAAGSGQGSAWWWRAGAALAGVLGSGAAGCLWVRGRRSGTLHWQGEQWGWQGAEPAAPWRALAQAPEVAWDGQRAMLLKLRTAQPGGGSVHWLWVAAWQPQPLGLQAQRWGDLRRAVYSPATVRPAAPAL